MRFFSKKDKPEHQEIFLSDKNRMLRIILLCVFLGIAIVAIAIGVSDFLSVDPGWQEVDAISDSTNCSGDFTLQYYFTDSGAAATAVKKDLVSIYSDACHKAYQLFTPDQAVEGMNNVYAINHAVNKELEIDPVLYEAFALLEEYGNRNIYLGPVYQMYNNIYFSTDDDTALYWDPAHDRDSAEFAALAAAFAGDPESIRLELLGDNRVILRVSVEYAAFAEAHEVENFIDFHWMTNAFIIDYFADLLLERGYTKGFIASRDGYTRNLNKGTEFSFNLFDKNRGQLVPAGAMTYDRSLSIVFLRDYPMTQEDAVQYYTYADGTVVSPYISLADGMNKYAIPQLVSYSDCLGCARILMEVTPVFIADSFDADALAALAEHGVQSIWCRDTVFYYTEAGLSVQKLYQDENYQYTAQRYQ